MAQSIYQENTSETDQEILPPAVKPDGITASDPTQAIAPPAAVVIQLKLLVKKTAPVLPEPVKPPTQYMEPRLETQL